MPYSIVRCETCLKELRVNFAVCLKQGWPECHGYTMTLIKHNLGSKLDYNDIKKLKRNTEIKKP